jgi:hypothetical protein
MKAKISTDNSLKLVLFIVTKKDFWFKCIVPILNHYLNLKERFHQLNLELLPMAATEDSCIRNDTIVLH